MRHTAAQFTIVPGTVIIYMCGASQTPSLRVVVSLGPIITFIWEPYEPDLCAISSDL